MLCCPRTQSQSQNGPYNGKKRRVFFLLNFRVARTEAGRLHSMLQLLQLVFRKIWLCRRNNNDHSFQTKHGFINWDMLIRKIINKHIFKETSLHPIKAGIW